MSKKALRLANALDCTQAGGIASDAADELRRLHADVVEIDGLVAAIHRCAVQQRLRRAITSEEARRAGLDYLALGDWHRTLQIGPATWYAGTPEADRFNSQEIGQALLVEIEGEERWFFGTADGETHGECWPTPESLTVEGGAS